MEETLIKIKDSKSDDQGWVFEVEVGENEDATRHKVTVPKDYYEKITSGKITAKELVKESFQFLLARESKEAILKEFNLPIIQKYFPDYEEKIKR